MTEYDNNFTGVLFRNDDKREGKKDPDYKGSAEVCGVQYWLAAWINAKKSDGTKFMSLKFTAKVAKDEAPKASPVSDPEFDDLEVPF